MLKKGIKFIFVFMAMTLFLTPAWGSTPDATDVEDRALTFLRNHEMAGTCVWGECLENQSVLVRGGGSGGGSGGGYGGGSHGKGSPGRNAEQQNQHQQQYQHQKKTKKQNQHQHQHQYRHQKKTEKQNQHQHQYKHREESGAQD